jgi:hypothetical protein
LRLSEKFTKLTDAEQAEFMELTKDSFDPGLYTEDDLPMLRANKREFEEEQRQEEGRIQPRDRAVRPRGGIAKVKGLSRDRLMALAQETYGKGSWSPDDVGALRACWEEFQRRGGENAIMFFRPAYFDVLKFHEIDSGVVGEHDVAMWERTGAEIATDYREVMRKLRAVGANEKPTQVDTA